MTVFKKRQERLYRELRDRKQASLLITCPFNVTYLTGFTGEDSFALVADSKLTIISDARYQEQLEAECPDEVIHIRESTEPIVDAAASVIKSRKLTSCSIESQSTSLFQWERLQELLSTVALSSSRGVIERLRERKDAVELEAIERAIDMAQRAFASVTAMIQPDTTEKQIANELEYAIRRLGGSGSAFKSIVGVGPRAALPHGRPSERMVRESPFVLVDWGAKENLYLSDITRVVVTGKVPAKLEKMYHAVLAAQEAAIRAIRPGALMSEIDAIARGVLDQAGFGKLFTHGLGHSFGLQIHESVRLARGQDRPLEPDMVVTVEPGVYLPGFGGVRIEDDVLVTKTGNRVLTSLPKNWDEVRIY